jgi:hypothetical protein
MCTRAKLALPVTTVPGSDVMIHGIMSAIDDFAERETGHSEYFWDGPTAAAAARRARSWLRP